MSFCGLSIESVTTRWSKLEEHFFYETFKRLEEISIHFVFPRFVVQGLRTCTY